MKRSYLDDSINIAIDIDTDKAVNAIASHAANLAFNVTKFVLDRAVSDTRKVYSEVAAIASSITTKVQSDCTATIEAGTTAQEKVAETLDTAYATTKASVQDALIEATETREALITASKIKASNAIEVHVTQPIAAQVAIASTFFNDRKAEISQAIADYCKVSEVKVEVKEVSPTLLEETPQVIGGALVSSAGVTSLDAVTEDQSQVKERPAPKNLAVLPFFSPNQKPISSETSDISDRN